MPTTETPGGTDAFIARIAEAFKVDPAILAVKKSISTIVSLPGDLITKPAASDRIIAPITRDAVTSKDVPIADHKANHSPSYLALKKDGVKPKCNCAVTKLQCNVCQRKKLLKATHGDYVKKPSAVMVEDWEILKPIGGEGFVEEDIAVVEKNELAFDVEEFFDFDEADEHFVEI